MDIVSIAAAGLAAVILATQLRSIKSDFGIYIAIVAGVFIFFYGAGKLKIILDTIVKIQSYINISDNYMRLLIKMIGITYIAQFAAGICRDSGYGAIGTQIEIFGKLSILAISMPVILALMETMKVYLT